jgi:hypothetical protein
LKQFLPGYYQDVGSASKNIGLFAAIQTLGRGQRDIGALPVLLRAAAKPGYR